MPLLYHHARPFDCLAYGVIKGEDNHQCRAEHADEPEMRQAFKWLESKVGFYPLFLSVGNTSRAREITYYCRNWEKPEKNKLKNPPNYVMFSFDEMEGTFMDYDYWNIHIIFREDLLRMIKDKALRQERSQITKEDEEALLIPRFSKEEWLKTARSRNYTVQLVVPEIDLRNARRVWVRNKTTQKKMKEMGFRNVQVKRLS